MIIRLTQKLARKIKVTPTTLAPSPPDPFADWVASLFTVERTQYILLTHSASLYSVILYGRGISESDTFIDHALSALADCMRDAGHSQIFEARIAPLAGNVIFSKTNDRSVLGSMNDHIQRAKFHLLDEGPAVVAKRLNTTPMGTLDCGYPTDALVKLATPESEKNKAANVIQFPRKQFSEQAAPKPEPYPQRTPEDRSKPPKGAEEKKPPSQKRAETIAFQKEMHALFDELRRPHGKKARLDQAQQLIYDAWESTPARARKLAHEALNLSPDCADAYILLADLESSTIREQIAWLRKGVEAGRRALGKKFFKENIGHFWALDSRPFMRAMGELAALCWEIGQADEAIGLWQEMLRLNPNDNQGVRYALLSCLLELGRDEEAERLLSDYEGDGAAEWVYGAALLAFRRQGDTKTSRQILQTALKINPFVPSYLLGKKKIPKRLPEYISWGDETEAQAYASASAAGWRKTENALAWLRQQSGE